MEGSGVPCALCVISAYTHEETEAQRSCGLSLCLEGPGLEPEAAAPHTVCFPRR